MTTSYQGVSKIITIGIILNYNEWRLTYETANNAMNNGLFNKTIIVDNASLNNSYQKLQALQNEYIDVIKTDYNGGYSYGNNYGIRYAIQKYNADIIVIMNPDVVVEKPAINACINVLYKDQTIGVISPIMLDRNGEINKSFAWKFPNFLNNILYCSTLLSKMFVKYQDKIYYDYKSIKKLDYYYVDAIPGSLMIFNRKALELAGFFDDNVFLFYEEQIISKRLQDKGYNIAIKPDFNYLHFHSTTIQSNINKIKRYQIVSKSRYYYLKKYEKISGTKLLLYSIVRNLLFIEKIFLIPVSNLRAKFKDM